VEEGFICLGKPHAAKAGPYWATDGPIREFECHAELTSILTCEIPI